MWLIVMFDLPVKRKKDRRAAQVFRNELLEFGFQMVQFSVYTRFCEHSERVDTFRRRVKKRLPSGGEVRIFAITDRQYSAMSIFRGKRRVQNETGPQQVLLL